MLVDFYVLLSKKSCFTRQIRFCFWSNHSQQTYQARGILALAALSHQYYSTAATAVVRALYGSSTYHSTWCRAEQAVLPDCYCSWCTGTMTCIELYVRDTHICEHPVMYKRRATPCAHHAGSSDPSCRESSPYAAPGPYPETGTSASQGQQRLACRPRTRAFSQLSTDRPRIGSPPTRRRS